MAEENEQAEYFEVYYHANQFSNLFFYSVDSLEEAKRLMKKQYPQMRVVDENNAKHPFIRIVHKIHTEDEIIKLYFFNITN